MNQLPENLQRLQFLARVVSKEIAHLRLTDQRLFTVPFSRDRASELSDNVDLAERVDAFVSRFSRLQDTVGDKLLPNYLSALGELTGPAIDNLNKAEKLGLVESAELWVTLRGLRNEMIHEYMEDLEQLANALNRGHQHVPYITNDAERILTDIKGRGWISTE